MLSAVGFNDEPSFRTGEIDDIWGEHELSTETPAQLLVTQYLPKRALSIGRIVTQLPRPHAGLFTTSHIPSRIQHQPPP
jgi:hypothetical protein